jgi:hypothetical protein
LLPLLSFEFRVSISQLKIAGQLRTQNWKLGTLKSGSEQPYISEGPLWAQCCGKNYAAVGETPAL